MFPPSLLTLLSQLPADPAKPPDDPRLPNGKLQSEEILKAEHKRNLADLQSILKLAGEIQSELEKTEHHVLSIANLKRLDEIEKITKRLRSRLKR